MFVKPLKIKHQWLNLKGENKNFESEQLFSHVNFIINNNCQLFYACKIKQR